MTTIFDGFLLSREAVLCVPTCSFREHIIRDLHDLSGLFVLDKTIALVKQDHYWPRVWRDMAEFFFRCHIFLFSKRQSRNNGLYTPLPVPSAP